MIKMSTTFMSVVESYVDYIHELYSKLQNGKQKGLSERRKHAHLPSAHPHNRKHTQRGVVFDVSRSWS